VSKHEEVGPETGRYRQHYHNGIEAFVDYTPPFDCIAGLCIIDGCPGGPGNRETHGRGPGRHRHVLRGEGVAVQFVYFDDQWLCGPPLSPHLRRMFPLASDLGHHTISPLYTDQPTMEKCDLFAGAPCYYDGSTLNADPGLEILTTQGEEALWDWLEAYFHSVMGDVMDSLDATR